jgi:hypothetical protein
MPARRGTLLPFSKARRRALSHVNIIHNPEPRRLAAHILKRGRGQTQQHRSAVGRDSIFGCKEFKFMDDSVLDMGWRKCLCTQKYLGPWGGGRSWARGGHAN